MINVLGPWMLPILLICAFTGNFVLLATLPLILIVMLISEGNEEFKGKDKKEDGK